MAGGDPSPEIGAKPGCRVSQIPRRLGPPRRDQPAVIPRFDPFQASITGLHSSLD